MTADLKRLSDATLVASVAEGRLEEFRRLVERYEPFVYGTAMSYLKNPDEAREVTTKAFVKAYEDIESLDDASHFASWLGRITAAATGDALSDLKASKDGGADIGPRRIVLDEEEIEPLGEIEQAELRTRLYKKIRTLPRKYRTPVILKYVYGIDSKSIARFLGNERETVKHRLHEVKKRLARYYRAARVGSSAKARKHRGSTEEA